MELSQETRDYIARESERIWTEVDRENKRRRRHIEVLFMVILSFVLAIFMVIVALSTARADPGDKYEFSNRQGGHALLAKAAGHAIFTPMEASLVGGRPSECPRKYCGCALSLKLFGRVIPKLNLAANWPRTFPRASAAPGYVAARRGHVMLLVAHVRGAQWLVYDPNSGQGRTREHVRSIAGFTVVNPHARLAAR